MIRHKKKDAELDVIIYDQLRFKIGLKIFEKIFQFYSFCAHFNEFLILIPTTVVHHALDQ